MFCFLQAISVFNVVLGGGGGGGGNSQSQLKISFTAETACHTE